MIRWSLVALVLAGCLDTPPSGIAGDDGGGGTDGDGSPAGSSLVLTGLAARDPLTLDLRDELVLIGRRDGQPVAVILYPGESALEDVTAAEVPLPFEPIDLTITRWGAATGMAIALGPGGELLGIDEGGTLYELALADQGERIAPELHQLAELNVGGRRLTLADGEQVYLTDPLGVGEPGELPIEIGVTQEVTGALLVDSAFSSDAAAVGVVEGNHEIDVYPVTVVGEDTSIGTDRVVGDLAPDPLLRPSWHMGGTSMVLIGIDPAGPRLWYHSTSMDVVDIVSGSVADGEFDALHDAVITRLDAAIGELSVLAEQAGQLEVVVYRNPATTPDPLPPALVLPVSGMKPPFWLQAMDAVLDDGDPGQNEIVVYDATGHLACIDLVDDTLASCGTFDLAGADGLTASGASTSGRPGW